MKYQIKFPSMADSVEMELTSTMQAVAYAINHCSGEDLWRMSDQCSDTFKASGLYIDIPSDEDPDDFTTVAYITATANGDNYDLSFEDEAGTVHTIKEVEKVPVTIVMEYEYLLRSDEGVTDENIFARVKHIILEVEN